MYKKGVGCSLVNEELNPIKRKVRTGEYAPEIWTNTTITTNPKLEETLKKAFDKEGETKLNTRAVVIIKNGKIIGEAYADGIGTNTPLLGWSMAKSITGILAGILEKDAHWKLDDPIPVYDWKNDERKNISLRNVMNMTTGLEWEEDYASVSPATLMLYSRDNMGAHAASYPSEYPPGAYWEYSSGTTNILA